MIPRQIFQTWKTHKLSPEFYNMTVGTWKHHNPAYKYTLYDDAECVAFLKTHFDEDIVETYNDIQPGAIKADFWRYCVLYVHGGVYADIDTFCVGNLDAVLGNHTFVTVVDLNGHPFEGKHNLFNAFIASVPGHPILKGCIDRIKKQVLFHELPASRLDWAGPGVLGRETNLYLGREETAGFVGGEGVYDDRRLRLIHFSPVDEVVSCDGVGIFQNKNGNLPLSALYHKECDYSGVKSWVIYKEPW
jgi:hypothetical protein